MGVGKPQKLRARVSEKYYLNESEKFLLVKFELVEPNTLEFEAGQYVSILVGERGERRSYSIASTPDDMHGVTIVAEMVEGGVGSKYLAEVGVGEEVEILGPLGQLVVRGEKEKLLFVATGSGIVPLWSMINDLLINKGEKRPMRLSWGMRSEEQMFWFDNLERLSQEHPNFVFDQVLSQPSEEWMLCTGHVQDCLRRDFAEVAMEEWEAYVCGNPKMVQEVTEELVRLGVEPERVYQERFA